MSATPTPVDRFPARRAAARAQPCWHGRCKYLCIATCRRVRFVAIPRRPSACAARRRRPSRRGVTRCTGSIPDACLPETRGRVTQFLLNPHGEIDGLILNGDLQVHVPPHLGRELVRHVAPGDRIRVRGVKPRGAEMIAAVQLTGRDGVDIVDTGPQPHAPAHAHAHTKRTPMEASGEIAFALHGPKGDVNGALLTTGIALRMPPHAAAELDAYLRAGMHVQVWGDAVVTRHGTTIDVSEIAELVDAPAD
ncbi:hypothetical protein BDAG_04805 [Burkholderia dolosa AU0158]|nr:hypothetical protein BDAG_04805 [Burkholderia dolosa AU0158]